MSESSGGETKHVAAQAPGSGQPEEAPSGGRPRGLRGLVMLYTGEGKGKTTAAFGMALRAVGRGWNVSMIQFTKMGEWPKGEPLGEIAGAERLAPNFEVIPTGIGFVNIFGDPYTLEEHREAAQKGLALAREKMASGQYQLVILDEILGAVDQGQLDLEQIEELIRTRPHGLNLLLTGHDANKRFLDRLLPLVDLATEMVKLKHPFDQGHQARKGLDY
ncbi:MAG TPA: cob(I)yrinic acid a,c-diamide adenosyltransferase [Dehalococcoidia bacterium]|nr:cob(I)yrinic acid a,c-diamide adenosyltransferase [Dehalococcoidia bacterium]